MRGPSPKGEGRVREVLRDANGLQYFPSTRLRQSGRRLTDHLGSTVAITDSNGTLTSQQRYLPFGGTRTNVTSPNSPGTDFGYTGQRDLDPGMGGLMDYKFRMYSPVLGRFISPDTLIPDATNPQAWNRFSYVVNRPINLNDPTGHEFTPNCPICSLVISYSNVTGGWNKVIDWASTVTCLVANCHVDREKDIITGPSVEEAMNAAVLGMVSPMGLPTSPRLPPLKGKFPTQVNEIEGQLVLQRKVTSKKGKLSQSSPAVRVIRGKMLISRTQR